jgi:hypothetical protein
VEPGGDNARPRSPSQDLSISAKQNHHLQRPAKSKEARQKSDKVLGTLILDTLVTYEPSTHQKRGKNSAADP